MVFIGSVLTSKAHTWADEIDDDGLPPPQIISNPDNTKTVISYRINEDGKKVRVTQKVREITSQERVNHAVAERKKWAKYGLEKGSPAGPNLTTTSVGEELGFRLGLKPTKEEQEKEAAIASSERQVPTKKVVCRTCGGEHFTLRCPYKDALGSADALTENDPSAILGTPPHGEASPTPGVYVPPRLRGKLADPGRTPVDDRDDSATLRVSNLSEDVVEDELRGLFGHFGRIMRCHLVRDRDTGRSRGFAFVSYELQSDAELACKKLNGYGLDNLIMRVEFSKK
jgi:translation initiation factor 3 subunit G